MHVNDDASQMHIPVVDQCWSWFEAFFRVRPDPSASTARIGRPLHMERNSIVAKSSDTRCWLKPNFRMHGRWCIAETRYEIGIGEKQVGQTGQSHSSRSSEGYEMSKDQGRRLMEPLPVIGDVSGDLGPRYTAEGLGHVSLTYARLAGGRCLFISSRQRLCVAQACVHVEAPKGERRTRYVTLDQSRSTSSLTPPGSPGDP